MHTYLQTKFKLDFEYILVIVSVYCNSIFSWTWSKLNNVMFVGLHKARCVDNLNIRGILAFNWQLLWWLGPTFILFNRSCKQENPLKIWKWKCSICFINIDNLCTKIKDIYMSFELRQSNGLIYWIIIKNLVPLLPFNCWQ